MIPILTADLEGTAGSTIIPASAFDPHQDPSHFQINTAPQFQFYDETGALDCTTSYQPVLDGGVMFTTSSQDGSYLMYPTGNGSGGSSSCDVSGYLPSSSFVGAAADGGGIICPAVEAEEQQQLPQLPQQQLLGDLSSGKGSNHSDKIAAPIAAILESKNFSALKMNLPGNNSGNNKGGRKKKNSSNNSIVSHNANSNNFSITPAQ